MALTTLIPVNRDRLLKSALRRDLHEVEQAFDGRCRHLRQEGISHCETRLRLVAKHLTDYLLVLGVIWSSKCVDVHLVGREPVGNDFLIVAAKNREAGREQDDSLETVSEEGVMGLGKAVDHLGCALGVADVSKLGLAGHCEDLFYVGWLVS